MQKCHCKLNALTKVSGYMNPEKRKLIMNASFRFSLPAIL